MKLFFVSLFTLIAFFVSSTAIAQSSADDKVSKTVGQLEGLYPAVEMLHWLLKQAEGRQPTYINYAVWRVWTWNMHNPSWQLRSEIDSAAFILAMERLESLEEYSTNAYINHVELRGVKKGSIEEFVIKDRLRKDPEIKTKKREINKIFEDKTAMPTYGQVLKNVEQLLEYMKAEIKDERHVDRNLQIYKDAKKQTLRRSLQFLGTLFFMPQITDNSSEVAGPESLQQLLDNLNKVQEQLKSIGVDNEVLKITNEYIKNILQVQQSVAKRSFLDKLLKRNYFKDPFGAMNNVFHVQFVIAVSNYLSAQPCLTSLIKLK